MRPAAKAAIPSPKTGRELVDEYFIENRTRLLEIAAFLDRLDRRDPGLAERDFRVRAFREGIAVLADTSESDETRVQRIQMILSDPTTEPLEKLDQKSARGAYDRWNLGVA